MKVGTRVKAVFANKNREIDEEGVIKRILGNCLPYKVQWANGKVEWCDAVELMYPRIKAPKPATIEVMPYKKGFRLGFKAANGKILNHEFNTVAGAKRGIKAFEKLLDNYTIVTPKKK